MEQREICEINASSTAALGTVIGGTIALVGWVPYWILTPTQGTVTLVTWFVYWMFAIGLIAMSGALNGFIVAWLYNAATKRVGGIVLRLDEA